MLNKNITFGANYKYQSKERWESCI